MKHAYLIIAHNEFDTLRLLVNTLDDERNDIFVHIDKKVRQMPELHTDKSRMYVIERRIDVRWGNVSQIETELLLWEVTRQNGPYDFYHLISGTHLPLKSQDELQLFFEQYSGKCIFSNLAKRDKDYQEILKLHRLNICTRGYAVQNKFIARLSQFIWKSFIAVQRFLKITVNDGIQFYWANNWCSLPQDAVDFILANKRAILKRYRWSFCGDEWFAPTELMASDLKDKVIDSEQLLYGTIGKSNAHVLTMNDAEDISRSNCCFGRKFTGESKELIEFLKING